MRKQSMSHEDVLYLLREGYDVPRGWASYTQPYWHQVVCRMWRHMWIRCYDPVSSRYNDYKDSTIHDDFRSLSNYIDFIKSQPRFEEFCSTCHEIRWSVDKDMKKKDNKNYYPEYMTLCPLSENSRYRNLNYDYSKMNNSFKRKDIQDKCRRARLKPIIGISVEGKGIHLFKYIRQVSEKGFDYSTVSKCCKGRYNRKHKGYIWYFINYKHNRRYRVQL